MAPKKIYAKYQSIQTAAAFVRRIFLKIIHIQTYV